MADRKRIYGRRNRFRYSERHDDSATVLMYAASTGKALVVERLLQAYPNTALETLDGFSSLDMAATVECLTLLRRAVG
jgi:thiosulfate/3-mercaptopyruvate sulfurtransferase